MLLSKFSMSYFSIYRCILIKSMSDDRKLWNVLLQPPPIFIRPWSFDFAPNKSYGKIVKWMYRLSALKIQALQTRYNLLSQLYTRYLYASITSIYTLDSIFIIAIHSTHICIAQFVFYEQIRHLYLSCVYSVYI